MTKKAREASANKLRAATHELARQANRTKEQLDKVQDAADALTAKAIGHKTGKHRKPAG